MKRQDIQILRGISVLSVIAYHAAPERFMNGYLGVDIFFTISGFLVTPKIIEALTKRNVASKEIYLSLIQFYRKRFFRLAPSAFNAMWFTTFLVIIFIPPADFRKTFGQMFLSIFALGNLGASIFSGDYFSPHPSPLIHTWSLAVEEQIYFILPLAIIFIARICRKTIDKTVLLVLAVLTFASFLLHLTVPALYNNQETWLNINFYSPMTRFFEFGLGALVAVVGFTINIGRRSPLIIYGIICLTLLAPIGFSSLAQYSVLAFSLLVIAQPANCVRERKFRLIEKIGDQSYSLYLFHLPLLYVAFYSPLLPSQQNREIWKLIAAVLAFPVAYLNFRNYESRWVQKRMQLSTSGVRKKIILWIGLPALFSLFLFTGSSHAFFGLDPNQQPLPDPALSLKRCFSIEGKYPCIETSDSNPNMVLLIGDSHARHLSKSFKKVVLKRGLNPVFWTQSGCQFILSGTVQNKKFSTLQEKYGVRHKGETQSCFAHNKQVILWLRKHPNVTTVLTFRSTSMVENDLGIDPEIYRSVLLKNIYILKRFTPRLVVIGPNPEYLDRSQFFGGGTLIWQRPYESTASSFELKSEMVLNAFNDDSYLRNALFGKNGIRYISAVSRLCDVNRCFRKFQGNWLYTNVDHLSYFGTLPLENDLFSSIDNSS